MLCCSGLREAALECFEEVHRHLGEALVPALQALDDPPRNLPLLQARLQDAGRATLPEPELLAADSLSAALQQEHVMLLPSQGDAPGATGGAYVADALSDRSAEVGCLRGGPSHVPFSITVDLWAACCAVRQVCGDAMRASTMPGHRRKAPQTPSELVQAHAHLGC